MKNLKNTTITKEQKKILSNAESILYSCENDLGNFIEKEFIKRRIFANDIYYPLIEKWDKEYTKLHCDEEKISMKKF